MCRGMILPILYLIRPTLWFHKIFKLIFPKSSCWSKTMYAKHWKKLWTTFLWHFPILWYNNSVEYLWTVAYLNMLLCFQSKKVFTGHFGFLFWFSSAILLSKIKSLFLNLYTSPQENVSTSTSYYHGKCVLVCKLKDFR